MLAAALPAISGMNAQTAADAKRRGAIERAVDYLAVEVRDWSRKNKCFSCHNNGVGAVALLAASEAGYDVPTEALAETLEWLKDPRRWDDNPGDPAFSDKKLARIHFAWARASAVNARAIDSGGSAAGAAELLAAEQSESGAWVVDPEQTVGSPVTLGDMLATYLVVATLDGSPGAERYAAKARAWMGRARSRSTIDRAIKLVALTAGRLRDEGGIQVGATKDSPKGGRGEIGSLLDSLLQSRGSDGGWGPFPGTPAEVFDTSIAIWAMGSLANSDYCDQRDCAAAVDRGVEYLLGAQLAEGGWPETTRPSGGQSYAQHIATTAWALHGLLAVEEM